VPDTTPTPPSTPQASEPTDDTPARRFHPATVGTLARLDHWMMQSPWHPRVTPFILYIALLAVIGLLRDAWPWSYPVGYVIQCSLVAALLWRYRRLTPELNLRFHWLAMVAGVGVAFVWIGLRMIVDEYDTVRRLGLGPFTAHLLQWIAQPDAAPTRLADPNATNFLDEMGRSMGTVALGLRLVGMSVLVPLFEELFARSLLLRSFSGGKRAVKGLLQVVMDIPVLGDALAHSPPGRWAQSPTVVFSDEFERTPLGVITASGFIISTLVFMVGHVPRDYPGAIACAAVYCAVLAATRHRGLGPVVWAHGITNALLWVYTIHTDDWRFL